MADSDPTDTLLKVSTEATVSISIQKYKTKLQKPGENLTFGFLPIITYYKTKPHHFEKACQIAT